MELIKITEQQGQKAVSMKDLYLFLEVKENWTDWTKRMLSYGFVENFDYQAVSVFMPHTNGVGGTTKKDYALTIDCAKEISMLQRTDKGKQARLYFIEKEKQANNKPVAELSRIDLARMVIEAEEEKQRLTEQNAKLQYRSDYLDTIFGTEGYIKGSQVCKILPLGFGVRTLYKKLREMGVFFSNRNEPKQEISNKGYIVLKETEHNGRIYLTPCFTQKGLAYIAKKFGVVVPTAEMLRIK